MKRFISISFLLCVLTTPALAENNNYISVGIRDGFYDESALDIGGKFEFAKSSKNISYSLRPHVLIHDIVESRLSATVDVNPGKTFSPYIGVGVALNTDGNGNLDPMISAGLDLNVSKKVVLNAGVNRIFQGGDANGDTELSLGVGYRF